MPQVVKKTLWYLVLGFFIFYLLSQPVSFALAVRSLGEWIGSGFDQLIRFFNALVT